MIVSRSSIIGTPITMQAMYRGLETYFTHEQTSKGLVLAICTHRLRHVNLCCVAFPGHKARMPCFVRLVNRFF